MPDVWENIKSPIKNHRHGDYSWQEKSWPWDKMLSNCTNHDPIWGPQTHALRIRKETFEDLKKEHVKGRGRQQYLDKYQDCNDPFSQFYKNNIQDDVLQDKSYESFTRKINAAHSAIHNTLKCTTAYSTSTAYGMSKEIEIILFKLP